MCRKGFTIEKRKGSGRELQSLLHPARPPQFGECAEGLRVEQRLSLPGEG